LKVAAIGMEDGLGVSHSGFFRKIKTVVGIDSPKKSTVITLDSQPGARSSDG
jgi:hypothetical protein